jgi:hypothetical protein
MDETFETLRKVLHEDGKGEGYLNKRIALKRPKYHRAREIKVKETGP